jgi:ribosomal protein S6
MKKKPSIRKYEIMCLFQEDKKKKKQNKEELIKKIQSLTSGELKEKKLETEKLAFRIRVEDYLLLRLTTSPEKIVQIKQILQQLSIQYLLINLDKEKQIKVKEGLLDPDASPDPATERKKTPSNSIEGGRPVE